MLEFVFINILLLSAGLVLFVVVRSLPRVEESGELEKQNVIERWIVSGIPEKIDIVMNSSIEKFLRRFRVVLMKADNAANAWLKKVKLEPVAPKAVDFKEMSEESPMAVGVAREAEKANN